MTEKEKILEGLRILKEATCELEELFKDDKLFIKPDPQMDLADKFESKTKNKLRVRISKLLRQLGMSAHILGYKYCMCAIEMIYENPGYLTRITTSLYSEIAKKMDTTPSRVERALRHAVVYTWNNPLGMEAIEEVFGNSASYDKGNPTNKAFLAMIVEHLKLEDEEG